MKKLLLVLFAFVGIFAFSQQVESFITIFNDKISIRAIELYDNKVWYSGTDSKFGFVDLKNPNNQKQIQLSKKNLQFRTLAQDKKYFYTINVESPAEFFKIEKKSLKSEVIFKDTAKAAFYDALISHKRKFYTYSDPDKNLKLKFIKFDYNKKQFSSELYDKLLLRKGEGAFAGSNTNISAFENWIWIATSWKILKLNTKDNTIEQFYTGMETGFSTGIFSIDFSDENFGVAVGGNYMAPEDNENNIATTNNGGKDWKIQASGKNGGYKSCVKIRPHSNGKDMITIGSKNIEFSSDYGKTWTKISEEKSLFTCEWVDESTVVVAGKDRISILKLKF
ncbi:glycosyl hydrolase [Chryseobacterium sp. MYb264]|uniref:WD40/YVTN/BNR-like repeat-containing protein n=1 Tax=Chryseobacterium sp. MYb264 TaxID=2745153 RepID=UPI002E0D8446|nr:glycosyl hydrolase [Chryseobacterium sp. MYb264]